MPTLSQNLVLSRCPHCAVANPFLNSLQNYETDNHQKINPRKWRVYLCSSCGGLVLACAKNYNQPIDAYFPSSQEVDEQIPDRPRTFLQQAHESLHAPAGAVMLCASAVDSMLKLKGYTEGSLYKRIEKAATDHLITADMATWAHEVRLDANDQRHADEVANLPTNQDAVRVLDFAVALADFLFVLPSRVQRGLAADG